MALYLVSYDITEKDKSEYEALWIRLGELGATKILYSEWLIVAEVDQSSAIYGRIAPLTKQSDRLLIQEVLADATYDKLLISDGQFARLLENARR